MSSDFRMSAALSYDWRAYRSSAAARSDSGGTLSNDASRAGSVGGLAPWVSPRKFAGAFCALRLSRPRHAAATSVATTTDWAKRTYSPTRNSRTPVECVIPFDARPSTIQKYLSPARRLTLAGNATKVSEIVAD